MPVSAIEVQKHRSAKTRAKHREEGKRPIEAWIDETQLATIDAQKKELGFRSRGEVIAWMVENYENLQKKMERANIVLGDQQVSR